MANQFYGYGSSYGGPGSLSSSHLGSANPYLPGSSLMSPSWNPSLHPLPAVVDSSKYPALEKYSSSLYLNQVAGLRPPETGGAAYGSYPGKAYGGADPTPTLHLQLAGAVEPSLLPGMKRPSEVPPLALYHQTILRNLNGIGQSEALFSTSSLVKRPRNDNASHLPVYPQRPGEKVCHHYVLTRTCEFRDNCKFDHPLWVPEGGISDWKEVPRIIPPEFLPQRPGEPDCPYSRCTFGLQCKYNHPKNKVPETNDISILPPPSLLHNTKGLPIRPGEQDCPFYLKTGSCNYGVLCRYNHPDRNANNPLVAAALGHAVFSSSATNLPNGAINPAASLLPNINPYFAQTAAGVSPTIYPQRPGQIECDFYMKTGDCKFGVRCKFHHPIDRSAPTPSMGKQAVQQDVKLTLAGLPRREGSLFCRDYMNTGSCMYGAACQYDHPPPAEAIAKTTVPASTFGSGAAAAEEKDATKHSSKKKKQQQQQQQ